jgi:very-long-chain (3R)-3-hydroxyacyl-CoA dehydratase
MAPSTASKKRAAPTGPSPAARLWLIAYNLVSFFLWALVLSVTLKHLLLGPQTAAAPTRFAERVLERLRPLRGAVYTPRLAARLPAPLRVLLQRSSTLHAHVGGLVAFTQSLAVLEILHAATGLVRSPVPTTTIQVFSRLLLVWGVSERFDAAASSPFYASMILAWSITECVRYPFYAGGLMGSEGEGLLWAR